MDLLLDILALEEFAVQESPSPMNRVTTHYTSNFVATVIQLDLVSLFNTTQVSTVSCITAHLDKMSSLACN